MSEKPSIAQYKQFIEERKFQAYQCAACGNVIAPPIGTCYNCGSSEMKWTNVSGKGTLVAFTVIHVAPDEFLEEVPYFVALVELEEGTRISARLLGLNPNKPEDVQLGIPLILDYEKGKTGHTYLAFKPA